MDLFSLLNDLLPGASDLGSDLIHPTHELQGTDGNLMIGGLPAPWENSPDFHGDWDHDGIPNYADHYFGPGPVQPHFGSTLADDSSLHGHDQHQDNAVDNNSHLFGHPESLQHDGHDMSSHPPDHSTHTDIISLHGEEAIQGHLLEDNQVLFGDPVHEAQYFHPQEDLNSCAIAAQRGVLQSILGENIPESELRSIAIENGWYDGECGTTGECVGRILEYYGVSVEQHYHSSLQDLATALSENEKVIVALDASEITPGAISQNGPPLELPDAGHAVEVTGICQDDQGTWKVVINDPGYRDGAGRVIDMDHFLNAWDDFGRFSVITESHSETNYA